jgi:succinoglycan biosynthesis transport protein ExoP
MHLFQLIQILRARAKIIAVVLLLTLITALSVTLLMPNTYKATTSLVLNYKGTDPLTGVTSPGQMVSGYLPTYMSTQIDIIKSITVALEVVDQLKLAESPEFRETSYLETDAAASDADNWSIDSLMRKIGQLTAREPVPAEAAYPPADGDNDNLRIWIAQSLLGALEVKPSRDSSVINIVFKSGDPVLAANVANAFSDSYQRVSVELDANPSRSASAYFGEQLKKLRDDFELAQNRVSAYQKKHGIVNADERVDVENARLNELSNSLVVAQAQLMEALSRKNQAQGSRAYESPDVANNPLIQSLKTDLSRAQVKLSGIAEKYTPNHVAYQAAKAEVDNLKSELQTQTRIASRSVSNNADILARHESNLRAALEEQKAKVLDLNEKRDELALLTKDMENTQRTYEAVSKRLAETRIQGQSNQSDVALLHAANVPMSKAGPSMTVTLLLAAFVGAFLGACIAFLCELMDRRVRSARDLEQVLGMPVLATLGRGGSRSGKAEPRLLASPRRVRALPGA